MDQSTGARLPPFYEGRVRAIFVYEEDETRIQHNYRGCEGREQPERARASWRHSEWLRHEATRLSVPTVVARPWETVFQRSIALLALQTHPAL